MAGGKYLLDTVIVVAYLNRDPTVLQRLQGATLIVPSVVIGELYFGAYHSGRVAKNVAQVRELAARNTI